ncbi:peptidase [Campylobacter jejuni]|nr:peptidase [Campylobacter jejuni]
MFFLKYPLQKELKPFKLNTPKSLHFDFSPFSLF